jgi:hypothetical protein
MEYIAQFLKNPFSLGLILILMAGSLLIAKKASSKKLWLLVLLVLLVQGLGLVWQIQERQEALQKVLGTFSLPVWKSEATQAITSQLVNWLFALLIGSSLWWVFPKRGRRDALDERDILLFALGIMVTGWPAGLIFLVLSFGLAALGLLVFISLRRRQASERLIVTPFIMPAAMITYVFSSQLLAWTGLLVIRI